MTNLSNQRIIFTDKADEELLIIIRKYDLEEKREDVIKRLKEKRRSPIVIIDKFTKDFAQEKISDKELIASLQKELKVPQETAEKIAKDIKEKILPLLERISEEELEKPTESIETKKTMEEEKFRPVAPIKPPIEIEEIEEAAKTPTEKLGEKPIAKHPLPKKTPLGKKDSPEKKTTKKDDIYREPIE